MRNGGFEATQTISDPPIIHSVIINADSPFASWFITCRTWPNRKNAVYVSTMICVVLYS